jgi:hypothetical protein
MMLEIGVWILFSVFIAYLNIIKTDFFNKNKKFKKAIHTVALLKDKPRKNLEEQKDYIRNKSDLGLDFSNTVFSLVIFCIIFLFFIFPRLPNFTLGLIVAVTLSIIGALLFALWRPAFKDFAFIDTFIGYLYASVFLDYVKFLDTPNSLILLIIGLITMFVAGRLMR